MLHPESPLIDSPWLPPRTAAAYLGIAIGTLRNWTSFGRVPYVKRGRIVRYHRDHLDRWLWAAACHPATAAGNEMTNHKRA